MMEVTLFEVLMTLLHEQLFWAETQHQLLELESLPELTQRQRDELSAWCKKRRKILNYEVALQPWIKVNIDGETTEVNMFPSGKAVEKNLFGTQELVGAWKIIDGILFVAFQIGQRVVEYRVVGQRENNIHCGSEYVNGQPSSYIKFIQTKPL